MKHDIIRFQSEVWDLTVTGGKVSGLKKNKIEKSSARVFHDGKIYSSAQIGQASDEQLIAMAKKPGNVGLAYDYDLPKAESQTSFVQAAYSKEEVVQSFMQELENANQAYPQFKWSGFLKLSSERTLFHGDYTGKLASGGESLEWVLSFASKGSADTNGYLYSRGVNANFAEHFESFKPFFGAVEKKANLKSQKMPVLILDPYDLADRFNFDVRADKFHAGSSHLSKMLGQKVLSTEVGLNDMSFAPEHGRYTNFDSEGVVRSNLEIIKNGVFTNVIYDLRGAKKFGKKSTGNGQRTHNTGVSCGAHELCFAPGQKSLMDLLKCTPKCLVILGGWGGGCNEQWEYSTPVQSAVLFSHGEAIGKIPAATIKGNMAEMLGQDLIGISQQGPLGAMQPSILTEMEVLIH